nr:4523_t:CDS:2 [Entrophospora candida]
MSNNSFKTFQQLSQQNSRKTKRYENLLKMKKTSEELAEYFDQLALQIQQLNEGCEVIGNVLRNWQNVFNFVQPENITAQNYSKITLKKPDSSNNDISNV